MLVKIRRFSGKELCGKKFVHEKKKEKCGGDGGKFCQKWADERFVCGKRKHQCHEFEGTSKVRSGRSIPAWALRSNDSDLQCGGFKGTVFFFPK